MLTFANLAPLLQSAVGIDAARAQFSVTPAEPPPATVQSSAGSPSASAYRRVGAVTRDIAMTIPAMRKAHHVIVGIPSTFKLAGWQGDTRLSADDRRCAWLRQPDPNRTLQSLLAFTLSDGLWQDRCLWRMQRDIAGTPTRFARVHPDRVQPITAPNDPDTVEAWVIDGELLGADEARFRENYLPFDFAGLGGLRRLGLPLLELYADLQTAAGNYARAPHPKAILKNHGAKLEDDEIDAVLADWNSRRSIGSVGYLDDDMDYVVTEGGWSPRDLQLVESREHSALEVARLVGLPARALDAKGGDPLTYGNIVEWRRDLLEAIRPWLTVVEQHLSMDDRSAVPRGRVLPLGLSARFDFDAYLRNDPKTRMETAEIGIRAGVLFPEEARAGEPLATLEGIPTPAAPATTTGGTDE